MKTYTKYIETNIPLLDQIPDHWELIKLRFLGDFSSSGIDKNIIEGESLVKIINYTDVYSNNSKILDSKREYMVVSCPDSKIKEHLVEKGDLIFTPSSETVEEIGFSALVNEKMNNTSFSYHVIRFKFKKEVDHNFKKYLCNNPYVLNYFSVESTGSTRKILDRGTFKNTRIALPSLQEQTQIARYLDYQTGIIDELIKKKEKLIELLKEKRQSIINEAVTKGLNPKLKMKDSGIDWLGEVPEGWKVSPLKHLASIKGRLGWKGLKAEEYVENGFGFLSTPDIKNEIIDFKSINYITEERYLESPEIMLELGDVLLVKDGSTLGIVNYIRELPFPSTVNSSIGIIRVINKTELNPEYLLWLLKSDYLQTVINSLKAGQGVPHLFQKDIKNFLLIVPPIKSQNQIVDLINKKNLLCNQILDKQNIQIEKLKEYRQSIISEAVTGKIDVREWQPIKNK